ncbi:MAG: glucose-6-phosphate isomerase family protein [Bacillota bacterium]
MILGKDFSISAEGLLTFEEEIIHPEPDVRRLEEAMEVLYDQAILPDNRPLYYMYREVVYPEDLELFRDHQIRYDITVILPGIIGREFIKTVGHFHPVKPHSSETYPEYYEVLSGEALYLLQKDTRDGDVEEIMVIEAKKGDKVYVAPGYGHITINPGEQPLVMANLVERNFSSLYEPFRLKRGAAYYCVREEIDKRDFIKNPTYKNSVGLQMIAAPTLIQQTDILKEKNLYQAFIMAPEALQFLK